MTGPQKVSKYKKSKKFWSHLSDHADHMFQNSQFQLFRHLQSRYGHGCVPMILADGTTALLVAGNNFSPPDLAEVGRVILVIGGGGGSLVNNRGENCDIGEDYDVCDGNN